jgi:hypothetical protein
VLERVAHAVRHEVRRHVRELTDQVRIPERDRDDFLLPRR